MHGSARRPQITYDAQADALRIILCDAEAERSREVARGVIISLDREGRVVAIEVLGAWAGIGKNRVDVASIVSQDLK